MTDPLPAQPPRKPDASPSEPTPPAADRPSRSGAEGWRRWLGPAATAALALLPVLLVARVYYWPAVVLGPEYLPYREDLAFEGYKLTRAGEVRGAWWRVGTDPLAGAPYDPATAPHPGTFEGVDLMALSGLTSRVLSPRVNLHFWQAAVLCVNGWIVAWLVRGLTGSALWAAVAVVMVMLNFPVSGRMWGHLQLLRLGWCILPVWTFHRIIEAPSARTGAALGLACALLLQGSFYPAFFLMIVLAPWWLALAFAGRLGARHWTAAAVAAAVFLPLAAATVWPVFMHSAGNAAAQENFFLRRRSDLWHFGAELWQYLVPPDAPLWRSLAESSRRLNTFEGEAYPGRVALIGAFAFLLARLRGVDPCPAAPRWLDRCFLMVAVMIILSLIGGPGVLIYDAVPMFRTYGRAGLVALALLCVAAPVTLHGLLARLPATRWGTGVRWAATAAVFAVALHDARLAGLSFSVSEPRPYPAWVEWLAAQPPEVSLIVLPSQKPRHDSYAEWSWEGLYFRPIHNHRTMNGGDWYALHRDLMGRGCALDTLNATGLEFLVSRGYVALAVSDEFLANHEWMPKHPALEPLTTLGQGWNVYRIRPDRVAPVAENMTDGFYGREEDGKAHVWRWCRRTGTLELENRTATAKTVRIATILRTATPQTTRLTVRLGEGDAAPRDVLDIGPTGTEYARTLVLPPGVSRVWFSTEGTPPVVNGSEIAFGILNFRMEVLPP
jgi:hypothetical protein